jgi:hypothetical protein
MVKIRKKNGEEIRRIGPYCMQEYETSQNVVVLASEFVQESGQSAVVSATESMSNLNGVAEPVRERQRAEESIPTSVTLPVPVWTVPGTHVLALESPWASQGECAQDSMTDQVVPPRLPAGGWRSAQESMSDHNPSTGSSVDALGVFPE